MAGCLRGCVNSSYESASLGGLFIGPSVPMIPVWMDPLFSAGEPHTLLDSAASMEGKLELLRIVSSEKPSLRGPIAGLAQCSERRRGRRKSRRAVMTCFDPNVRVADAGLNLYSRTSDAHAPICHHD